MITTLSQCTSITVHIITFTVRNIYIIYYGLNHCLIKGYSKCKFNQAMWQHNTFIINNYRYKKTKMFYDNLKILSKTLFCNLIKGICKSVQK